MKIRGMMQRLFKRRMARFSLCAATVLTLVLSGLALVLSGLALGLSGLTAQGQAPEQAPEGGFAMGPQGRMVRGTVTTAAGDNLTVKTETGDTYQVVVTSNTRLTKDRQPVKIGDVHPGDGVGAMGVLDAPTKTVHAVMLVVVDAAAVKKAREDLGKTYILGKVTAIDDVNLTILREDGVSQKITLDDGTSLKRGNRRLVGSIVEDPFAMAGGGGGGYRGQRGEGQGGQSAPGTGSGQGQGQRPQGGPPQAESITLADVKAGDQVAAKGALKSGVFVPSELVVIEAPPAGRRRGQGAPATGDGGATPPPVPPQ